MSSAVERRILPIGIQRVRIRQGEWVWAALASVFILFITSVPYLAGYWAQTESLIFNGAVYDRQDYAVHLATMHLGARGEWKYRLRFSNETQEGAYVKMGYIFIGQVARWLKLDIGSTYQLARLMFGFVACMLIYILAAYYFNDVFWRRMAFIMATMGAGLGWFQLLGGWLPRPDISPVDLWLIDAYVFFSLMTFPHFALVITLIVGMLLGSLSYLSKPSVWKAGIVIVLGMALETVQPYAPIIADLAICGALCGYYLQKREVSRALIGFIFVVALSQLPLLAYNIRVFGSNSIWRGFASQNITLSPPLAYYGWGLGPFWPFVIPIVALVWRCVRESQNRKASCERLPELGAGLAWAIGALCLAYLPTNLQRRFMIAITVPMAMLAMSGIKYVIFPWLEGKFPTTVMKRAPVLIVGLVALSTLSSLILVVNGVRQVLSYSKALFDPVVLTQAVDWLSKYAGPEDVVLGAEKTGLLIAARSGRPVYLGHPIETLDYPEKVEEVSNYFKGKSGREWLAKTGVRWVLVGEYERELAGAEIIQPDLPVAYQSSGVTIYRVEP